MDDPTNGGVPLGQYAAIYAAMAEGFALDVVLEAEGIGLSEWPEIDAAWGRATADDLRAHGTLQERLDAEMLRIQDTYRRPIPPLDEDVAAWLLFMRAWAAADDPVASLRSVGLRPTDLARLHRLWMKRLVDGGAAFQRELLDVAQEEGPPPTIPKPQPLELKPFRPGGRRSAPEKPMSSAPAVVPKRAPALTMSLPRVVERPALSPDALARDGERAPMERTLTPAPHVNLAYPVDITFVPGEAADPFAAFLPAGFAAPPAETVVPTAEHSLSDEMNLAQYAAICAELEFFPENGELIFIKYGVLNPERRQWIDREWQERLATRTQTFAEFRQLNQHFREHFMNLKRLAPLQRQVAAPPAAVQPAAPVSPSSLAQPEMTEAPPRSYAAPFPIPALAASPPSEETGTTFPVEGYAPGFDAAPVAGSRPSAPAENQPAGEGTLVVMGDAFNPSAPPVPSARFTEDGTMLMDEAFDPERAPAASKPTSSSTKPEKATPELTLEQYATILADVFVNGQTRFAAYGLGDLEARRAVQAAWNDRLRDEMTMSERFDRLYDEARERFRREKQGR